MPGTGRPISRAQRGRAGGQDGRGQGQHLRRRRADDERLARARGLCARRSMPPWSPASSRPAASSPARRPARICASRPAATPAPPDRSATRTTRSTRPADPPAAARRWSRPARSTMALGGDQGGSIRTPSCWCGVYGLKPTWGLVPMTGGMPISYSVDHCGPMCAQHRGRRPAADRDRRAGPHDPRTTIAAGRRLHGGARQGRQGHEDRRPEGGLRSPGQRSGDRPRKCARRSTDFKALGATVEDVSVPMHSTGRISGPAIILEGAAEMMIKGYGMGNNWQGYYTHLAAGSLRPRLALAAR